MAQPYFNQAADLYRQGATGANISNFFNPYAGAVTANLKDIFGQQMAQTTGNLTQQAGGVGADRIAVGQSELAKQQGLAAGQTLASLYQPALQAAQSAAFTGASGLANVGQGAQGAALQGSQALLGTGGLQQQLAQAQLNSPYQQQLAQAAFPYQQAQFLAGITGSLAPGLGGTTTGQSQTTKPGPSLFSQILGGITGGVGLLGGTGAFGNNGWMTGGKGSGNEAYGGNGVWGGSSQYPLAGLSPEDYGSGFARGGRTDPFVVDLPRRGDGSYGYDDGGPVPDDPMSVIPEVPLAAPQVHVPQLNLAPPKEESGSGGGGKGSGVGDIAKLAMMFVNRGGRVNPYADGGGVSDEPDFLEKIARSLHEGRDLGQRTFYNRTRAGLWNSATAPEEGSTYGGLGPGLRTRRFLDTMEAQRISDKFRGQGYAAGGALEDDDPSPATFDERFPYRMPEPAAYEAWRADAPAMDRAEDVPVMAFSGEPAARALPARVGQAGAASTLPPPPAAEDVNPYSPSTAVNPEGPYARQDSSSSFAASPWAALMAAGLGMMAGTSPFAGVNIGQGGLQGLKTLEAQRAAAQKDTTIAQAARRLELEAKHHEDQYTRMTPYQKAQVAKAERDAAIEALKPVQIGQDAYGRPVYAKRNAKTGEYEEIRPSQDAAPAAPPAPVVPAVPAVPGQDESALPVNAKPTQGLLPNGTFGPVEPPKEGTDPAALEGMRPGDVKLVKAIAEGRQKFLPIGRNNPYNRMIMEKVHEYDPNVDETAFSRRQRTANFFAVGTQGGGGQNITAMNTFGQHAEELLRLSEELKMGNYPTLNALRTALAKQGLTEREIQSKIGAWEVASKAVADEGAKVFAGSNSALADRESWQGKFDVNNPQSVTKEKLKEVVKLIEGRLNALTAQYNEGMRTTHEAKDFIAPRTREIFDRITSGKKEEKAGSEGPKVGERRQFKQGWGRWDGSKWVPD